MDVRDGYDDIAEQIYAPLFPFYAHLMVQRTGIHAGHALDVGCGGGHLGFALLDEGNFASMTFADASDGAIVRATERAEQLGRAAISRFAVADVTSLPFNDDSFALVASRGSIPFWEDQEAAIDEIFRVLAPGGYAYLGGGKGGKTLSSQIERDMKRQRALQRESSIGAPRSEAIGGGNSTPNDSVGSVSGDAPEERPCFFDRSQSKALSDEEYIGIFRKLGCGYGVISSPDEGHWIVFSKEAD